MSRDFCSCPCPGTKGHRDKNFFCPGTKGQRDVPSHGNTTWNTATLEWFASSISLFGLQFTRITDPAIDTGLLIFVKQIWWRLSVKRSLSFSINNAAAEENSDLLHFALLTLLRWQQHSRNNPLHVFTLSRLFHQRKGVVKSKINYLGNPVFSSTHAKI